MDRRPAPQLRSHEWPLVNGIDPTPTPLRLVRLVALPTFEAFYGDHRASIARALTMTLHDTDLAADATDEAMARAYAKWGQVSGLENPAGWVYRVGLNWGRSALRRRKRPRRVHHEILGDAEMPVRDLALHRALLGLDIDRRAVVVCRYFLGMSEAEVCAVLQLRPGTVKSRLHRALRDLELALIERPTRRMGA